MNFEDYTIDSAPNILSLLSSVRFLNILNFISENDYVIPKSVRGDFNKMHELVRGMVAKVRFSKDKTTFERNDGWAGDISEESQEYDTDFMNYLLWRFIRVFKVIIEAKNVDGKSLVSDLIRKAEFRVDQRTVSYLIRIVDEYEENKAEIDKAILDFEQYEQAFSKAIQSNNVAEQRAENGLYSLFELRSIFEEKGLLYIKSLKGELETIITQKINALFDRLESIYSSQPMSGNTDIIDRLRKVKLYISEVQWKEDPDKLSSKVCGLIDSSFLQSLNTDGVASADDIAEIKALFDEIDTKFYFNYKLISEFIDLVLEGKEGQPY